MITFENSPVQIGDLTLLANTASISIQTPVKGTTKFGTPGFYSQIRDGRSVGSLSVSYYMTEADTGVRNLFTGSGIQLVDMSVGPYQCYSGVANSMSMSIESYSVVSCTLDMSFYNGYDQTGSTSNITAPGDVIHGGTSEASTDLLWGTDIMSVNYSMEQSISPVYAFGELTPSGYTREGGTIEVDLQGTGWGHIIDTSTLCEGYTTGNISLDTLCELCTTSLVYTTYPPELRWTRLTPWETYEGILGTSICFSCWEVGDAVTLTWPEEAGVPWSIGISAQAFEIDECNGDSLAYARYRWDAAIGAAPEGYDITASNDSWRDRVGHDHHIISFSGYVTNPSISVEPNSEIVGSLTVFGSL